MASCVRIGAPTLGRTQATNRPAPSSGNCWRPGDLNPGGSQSRGALYPKTAAGQIYLMRTGRSRKENLSNFRATLPTLIVNISKSVLLG